MNHISKYRDFEIIDEKINWKRFLISFGIAYGLITGYKDIRDLRDARKIYSDITNPSSIPTPSERSTIDSIKNDLIAKVESSDLFNRFGKKYIIDSLKNTQFRVVDDIPIKFNGVILGMYIDIKKIKDEKKYKFLEIPKGDNFILPDKISAKMSDGKDKEFSVKWNSSDVDTQKAGSYTVTGKVAGFTKAVTLKLLVKEITKIQDLSGIIENYKDIKLPNGSLYNIGPIRTGSSTSDKVFDMDL